MLLWAVIGVVLIGVVLLDAFETVVLPRCHPPAAARAPGPPVALAAVVLPRTGNLAQRRASRDLPEFLWPVCSVPFAFRGVGLPGLSVGFALLLWSLDAQMVTTRGDAGFGTALYGSGTTFFTLGLGRRLPHTALGRLLVVLEAGIGFAFLALIIPQMPVLSQASSRSARSTCPCSTRVPGPPPSAADLLRREAGGELHPGPDTGAPGSGETAGPAELLESYVSCPTRSWPSIAPSTPSNPGSPGSPRFWMPGRPDPGGD